MELDIYLDTKNNIITNPGGKKLNKDGYQR